MGWVGGVKYLVAGSRVFVGITGERQGERVGTRVGKERGGVQCVSPGEKHTVNSQVSSKHL